MGTTLNDILQRKNNRTIGRSGIDSALPGYQATAPIQRPAVQQPKYSLLDQAEVSDPSVLPEGTHQGGYDPNQVIQPQRTSLSDVALKEAGKVSPEAMKAWMGNIGIQQPTSKEEDEARERRQRMALGWAGLAQGLSALSNLYYTTKWAPNQPLKDVVGPVYDRITRDNAERKQRQEAMDRQREQLKEQRDQADKDKADERAWQLKLLGEKEKIAAQQLEAKQSHDKLMLQLKDDLAKGRMAKKQADDIEKLSLRGKQAEALQARRAAHAERLAAIRRTRGTSGGGTSSPYGDTAMDEYGNWYNRTKRVSKDTKMQLVKEYGEDLDPENYRVQKGVDDYGNPKYGEPDYNEMYNDLVEGGYIPGSVLRKIGFTEASDAGGKAAAAPANTGKPAAQTVKKVNLKTGKVEAAAAKAESTKLAWE
jgi:hypothetical protein